MNTERYARTTNYAADDIGLLASVRYQGRWITRCYGPDEQVVEYTEWVTRDAAENVARKYAAAVTS